jgi:hypothetical protein
MEERKYQCFCCGVMFDDHLLFKSHILDEHEEGRDYVICPLKRCGFPVRSLPLHYKIAHPTEDIRKVKGPLKAIIWKDFSAKGKGRTKKPSFRSGTYTSTKTGKDYHYRSGWEQKVYELLDQDSEVLGYEAEPFQIDYIYKGMVHKYSPDLFVAFVDGHKEVWEIKPERQTLLEQNQSKWYSAKEACKVRGWGWQVITEQGIEKLKIKIRNQNLN